MEWMLDLTAEELEERSREELKDYLTPEHEERCRKHFNKLVAQAVEHGKTHVYLEGTSPSSSRLPLFGEFMSKDAPLMTEELKYHLEQKGLKVYVEYEPYHLLPQEDIWKAALDGSYYARVLISWAQEKKLHIGV